MPLGLPAFLCAFLGGARALRDEEDLFFSALTTFAGLGLLDLERERERRFLFLRTAADGLLDLDLDRQLLGLLERERLRERPFFLPFFVFFLPFFL